jgi:hypothetical protein
LKGAENVADEKTLSELLSMVTLDDIFVIMLVKNLKDGKTRANYQMLKEFFEELRLDPKEWASDQVKKVLNLVWAEDVDHMMTRVFGLSGLCSFKAEIGDDSCYMNERQAREAVKYYDRLGQEDKDSLDEIARRYRELLSGPRR